MMQGHIEELSLWGVYDRGIPNLERVVIRVQAPVDMASYGLMVGAASGTGGVLPVRDQFLWFGNGVLNTGDWIFVYTSPGTPRKVPVSSGSGEEMFILNWQRTQTIFHVPTYVPLLIRMDAFQMAPPPPPVPLPPPTANGLLGAFGSKVNGLV